MVIEEIYGEVAQLESEPELKQIGKSLEEPPFDIPNKWKWMQLKHLVKVIGGTSYKSADVIKSGVRIIRGGNLRDFSIQIRDDDVFLPVSFASDEKTVHQSDIVIVSSTGSKEVIGRPAVLKSNIKCQIGAFLRIIRPVVEEYSDYLKVIFQSDYYRNHIRATVSGTNINNVKNSYIENFYIPVPPIEEQRRIVECIQKLRPLVDAYQDAEKELESIEAYFPVKLKASILQEAIQGKLVPQLESEPEMPQIGGIPENIPFDIPSKWKWMSLENVLTEISDGSHNPPPNSGKGVPVLSAKNINNGIIDTQLVTRWTTEEQWAIEDRKIHIEPGDVLLTIVGTIGRTAVVPDDAPKFMLQRSVCVMKTKNFLNSKFLSLMLTSPALLEWMMDRASGTAQKGIYLKALRAMPLPIPPLSEQHRIVGKLTELFNKLNQIDKLK